jgi:hypothetical protein
MKKVRLNIKEVFLQQIVAGEKTEEIRDDTLYNRKLFCNLDENKQAVSFKKIDAIEFFTSRDSKAKKATVELIELYAGEYVDEDTGEDIGEYYIASVLGKVLEKNF